ncbi:FKBP-type peptidyl-prolyl cis-trans isomerase [Carnimonas nigrificans]|uniref:FKBP-type peptidyl-prolyl cis-trans isomerase n=1 Tax=Carnimonas nigrificans TaxID=64323 RepID=UPI00046F4660|nr:FKBP-type peptidyl-prolyl cis-trans isomerase [Carnimonas nigrificans]
MNKLVSAATVGAVVLALTGCSNSSDDNGSNDQAPQTDEQKVAYSIGMNVAQSLKQIDPELEISSFKQALDDVYSDRDPKLSQEDAQKVLMNFQQQMLEKQKNEQEQQQNEQKQEGQDNARAGEAFLKDNATKDGVKTTASGLQYKVLKSGEGGQHPEANDTVRVNYEGKQLDGKVFDSSYEKGKPVTFKVKEVIPGWQEALKLMQPGDEWEVYIPAKLAYGPGGVGPIGPNATLIFKVNLMDINPSDD